MLLSIIDSKLIQSSKKKVINIEIQSSNYNNKYKRHLNICDKIKLMFIEDYEKRSHKYIFSYVISVQIKQRHTSIYHARKENAEIYFTPFGKSREPFHPSSFVTR